MHKSGQWISERVLFPYNGDFTTPDGKQNNPAQEAGKVVTYARRYALASVLGIYSEEDVDGSSGEQIYNTTHNEQKPVRTASGAVTKETTRPYKPEELRKRLAEVAESMSPASDDAMSLLASMLNKVLKDKDIRHDAQEYLFGARSLTEVDRKLISAGLKWLNIDENYEVDELAEKELKSVQSAFLMSKGQQKMDALLKEKSI
jgi:hypothetical protein